MTERIPLPMRPTPPEPPPFPLIGALAPLLVAAVLFAATRSAEVLLFAAFSPVLAVAGVVDGRLQVRRRGHRDERAQAIALEAVGREAAARASAAAADLQRRHPSAAVLVADPGVDPSPAPQDEWSLGTADLAVEPTVTGMPVTAAERDVVAASALLADVPVLVPAAVRVAVIGRDPVALALARGLAVQRGRATGRLELPDAAADAGAAAPVVLVPEGVGAVRVARAAPPLAALQGRRLRAAMVTAASYAALERATTLERSAIPLENLLAAPAGRSGLRARFLTDGAEPVEVDLVADGPHAVVGGTTGSGKSALLTAWILALAAAHPPSDLVLLLVDCKGGAAFDPLRGLPHVGGIVTDLDGGGAARAVLSLRAELARRERALRRLTVPDVAASDLPRLVIVVDEFRHLVETQQELAAVFVDVAARGRSLGVHLILCTQRPAGSMRDELLTNCGLRLALRVTDAADSRAVVGVPDAAALPRAAVGATILTVAGDPPRRVRVASLDAAVVAGAVGRSVAAWGDERPSPPWLDPLPSRLPLAPLLAEAARVGEHQVVLGRLDLPDEQRQPVLTWDPVAQPRLLVVGDPGSGRSTALAVVAAQRDCSVLSADPATAWDQLHDDSRPLLVDGLERLVDLWGERHAQAAIDRLGVRLRRPGAAPTVLALRGPSGWGGTSYRMLLGLCDARLLLRLDREDHLAVGGSRETWSDLRQPGAAWWSGRRAQVALPPAPLVPAQAVATPPLPLTATLLVVSATPAARARELAAAGLATIAPGDPQPAGVHAVVGSPDAWQAQWSLLGRLRQDALLVTDGLAGIDYRTITGRSAPPPPVSHPLDVVLVPLEGPCERRRIPGPG